MLTIRSCEQKTSIENVGMYTFGAPQDWAGIVHVPIVMCVCVFKFHT